MAAVEDRSTESAWYAFMAFDPAQHRRVRGYYTQFFRGCRAVLDLACGRGEFLDVLKAQGIAGVGLDIDPGMAQQARQASHKVEEADAFDYLTSQRGAFDGIFSAHFVEHLPPDRAVELITRAFAALQPGGRLLLATPNSASLPTLQREFWWDASHVRFYDIDLLRFWLTQAGFEQVEGGTNPESWPGSPIGLDDLVVPKLPPLGFADKVVRRLGLSRLVQRTDATHHQLTVVAGALGTLLQELYRPNEIYVTGRKPAA